MQGIRFMYRRHCLTVFVEGDVDQGTTKDDAATTYSNAAIYPDVCTAFAVGDGISRRV